MLSRRNRLLTARDGRTRHRLLKSLAAVPLGLALGSSPALGGARKAGAAGKARRSPEHPNVLLITIDSLRADHLGAYGYAEAIAPNLDRFAAEGLRVDAAYTAMPSTNPAHAALLSGTYPARNGVYVHLVDTLDPELPTLAGALKAGGYGTAGIFSWHSFEPPFSGLQRGFDHYRGVAVDLEAYLEQQDEPTIPPEKRLDRLVYDTSSLDEGCDDCLDGGEATIRRIIAEWQPDFSPLQVAHLRALYDREIAFTDEQLGRLLAGLRERKLEADTAVIITSDHGESFNEHDLWLHGGGLYRNEMRVPLLIRYPDHLPAGQVLGGPVGLVDVMPTLLELAHLPIPKSVQGTSLLPLLTGVEPDGQRRAFAVAGDPVVSIATREWHLIYRPTDEYVELYRPGTDRGGGGRGRRPAAPAGDGRLAARAPRGGRRPAPDVGCVRLSRGRRQAPCRASRLAGLHRPSGARGKPGRGVEREASSLAPTRAPNSGPHHDVLAYALGRSDGQDAADPLYVGVCPAVLEEVQDDLGARSGERLEAPEERPGQDAALEAGPAKEIDADEVEALAAVGHVGESVLPNHFEAGHLKSQLGPGQGQNRRIRLHADHGGRAEAAVEQVDHR